MSKQAVAIVTGASRGLGQALARALTRQGFRVYGGGRSWSSESPQENFIQLDLDVDDDRSVKEAVGKVLEEEGGVDLLVNNAGVSVAGPVEEVPVMAARRLFETNYFGVTRMVQAVLPAMRRAGRGTIVNIGSAAGRIGIPFQGHYAASKFALEGLSEALRMELLPLGIRVLLIEPGDVRTTIWERRTHFEAKGSPYLPALRRFLKVKEREMGERASPPEEVAAQIVRIIASPTGRLRHPVGRGSWLALLGRRLLPDRWFFQVVENNYRIKRSEP